MGKTLTNLLGVAMTWGAWLWLIANPPAPSTGLVIALAGSVAVIPLVFIGRRLLDRQPDLEHAERVTAVVHYLLATFLGSALITASRLALHPADLPLRIPAWLGIVLMILGGAGIILVIFNLLLKGAGLPFALALTRQVVTGWMYAWTRNPMVLSGLAFLVGFGLWLQSGLFLVWLTAVASPAMWVFLKVYEERELEIRFGKSYQEYRASTPFFIPRRPRGL